MTYISSEKGVGVDKSAICRGGTCYPTVNVPTSKQWDPWVRDPALPPKSPSPLSTISHPINLTATVIWTSVRIRFGRLTRLVHYVGIPATVLYITYCHKRTNCSNSQGDKCLVSYFLYAAKLVFHHFYTQVIKLN